MGQRIKTRRDTTANWASANPVLLDGEVGYDKTLKQKKTGDGVTAWNALGFDRIDWNEVQNKPAIPAAQVNSDWNAVSGLAHILNKPALFNGDYNSLINKPTIVDATTVTIDGGAAAG